MKSPGTQRILHNTSPKVGEHELNNNDVREVLEEAEEQYVQQDDGDKKPWGKSKPLLKLPKAATAVVSCCDLLLICREFCQFFPLSIFSP